MQLLGIENFGEQQEEEEEEEEPNGGERAFKNIPSEWEPTSAVWLRGTTAGKHDVSATASRARAR